MIDSDFVAPPFKYTGNKFRHLEKIMKHVPKDISTFYDIFGGSGVVGINTLAAKKTERLHYNETCKEICHLFGAIWQEGFDLYAEEVNSKYPETLEGYLELRECYNKNFVGKPDLYGMAVLYCLICRSFNNQFRVNKSGEFNLPYGKRNRFDMESLTTASEIAKDRTVASMHDFRRLFSDGNIANFRKDSFFFFDPPYSNSTATYNTHWKEDDDVALYELLTELTAYGYRWMMTNTIINRGEGNPALKKFLGQSKVHILEELNGNHGNSSYHKSKLPTVEYLITNFR